MVLLGSLYQKDLDSKMFTNKQANTSSKWIPLEESIFLFVEFVVEFEENHICYVLAEID